MSIRTIKETCKDLFLVDFCEKKTRDYEIVTMNDFPQLSRTFKELEPENVLCACPRTECNYSPVFLHYNIQRFLTEYFPIVLNILHFGQGKISLCGIDIFKLISSNQIDIFTFGFDSCLPEEANKLLCGCLEILGKGTLYQSSSRYLAFNHLGSLSGQFLLNVYNNKGEMLRDIGPSPNRHGWNPITGYFGTTTSIVSCKLGMFPMDIEFKHQDIRCYTDVGLRVIFPGLTKETGTDSTGRINTTDGIISTRGLFLSTTFKISSISYESKYSGYTMTPNVSMNLFKDNYVPPIHPSFWLVPTSITFIIGINNDRYVAFANCRRSHNLDKYIFGLLCSHWLKAEAQDAKQRLLV